MHNTVADPRGASLPDQNYFNFMKFLGKYGKFVCWCPPGGLASPPMGNPGSVPAVWLKTFPQKTTIAKLKMKVFFEFLTEDFCEWSRTFSPIEMYVDIYLFTVCVLKWLNPGVCSFLLKFWQFSSELTKSWSSGARKYWTQKLFSNLTFTSFLLFVYMSVFYNIVQILFTN